MKNYWIGVLIMVVIVALCGLMLSVNPERFGIPLGIASALSFLVGYFIPKN